MIEGQRRQLIKRPPSHLRSIVARLSTLRFTLSTFHSEGCCHRTTSWIATGGTVYTYQSYVLLTDLQSRLFLQLAYCAVLNGLAHLHESSRQSPAILKGLVAASNQQHLVMSVGHNTVSRHHRPRIIIYILSFHKTLYLKCKNTKKNIPALFFYQKVMKETNKSWNKKRRKKTLWHTIIVAFSL